jgi:hypothetical protein
VGRDGLYQACKREGAGEMTESFDSDTAHQPCQGGMGRQTFYLRKGKGR